MINPSGRRRRIALATAVTLAALTVGTGVSRAVQQAGPGSRLLVTQLSTSPGWASGEAWVVANPNHPDVVTADWTSQPWPSPTAVLSGPGPHALQCGVGTSTDGGQTWKESTLPPFQQAAVPTNFGGCADPTLVADSNGTLYSIANGGSVLPTAESNGDDLPSPCCSFTKSTDNGLTWSVPTRVNTWADEAKHVPAGGAADDAFDRPWLVIDPNTGALYLSVSDDALVERVVFASHDHGKTWSAPYLLDPNDQTVWADVISAANGVLAAAYSVDPSSKGYEASPSPAVKCAQVCAVFETSVNDGKDWTRHIIKNATPTSASGGGPSAPGLEVAADPSTNGRYAVLVPETAAADQVWVTPDSGATWTKTLTINAINNSSRGDSASLAKPWIAYGPTGALAVVWRNLHSDGTYDVSTVISTNGGNSFGSPVLLTPGAAPKPPPPQGTPGDDCACYLYLNGKFLYTTWGDSRTGVLQVWYARYRY